jgi:uncharacterized membrane protein YfcA
MLPMILGLPAGVLLGTLLIARLDPAWMKVWTFACLIPLLLVQAAGYQRPLRWKARGGLAFGSGLGALYSITTISGPPLAMLLRNEGYAKHEFRAGVGLVRLAESTLTLAAYASAGLLTSASTNLILVIVPSLAIGVPLGAFLVQRVNAETFRRVCMSLDAWLVAFGLASVLRLLNVLDVAAASALVAAVAGGDIWLWWRRAGTPMVESPRAVGS